VKRHITIAFSFVLLALLSEGCQWYDDQTTYFNTYYNMNRIMKEVKDQFEYADESRRVMPRVLVPGLDSVASLDSTSGGLKQYNFLRAFVIDKAKLQPVNTKVDSILLKGSKVVANHPKSAYVEGSLFLMAESYFFRQDWVPSQQKCIELIERFTDGDFSPDAHLLLSKDYLLQRKISQGTQTLSRTIDIAWYKDRYDILSEAYRIQAEMALEDGDLDGAVAPYKQAIAQCENSEMRAKWQVDVASLYFRKGRFELAEQAFLKVHDYTPDVLAEFEADLYRASTLVKLGRLDEADEILQELDRNRNYKDWKSFIKAEQLALERARSGNLNDPTLVAEERKADTSFIGRPELMAQNFQKAMAYYKQNKYTEALIYFAKAKVIRTPVYEVSSKYYTLLKQWEDQHRKIEGFNGIVMERETMRDTVNIMKGKEIYALGRVHEQLSNRDSALFYYQLAYDSTPPRDKERAKYLFAIARIVGPEDPETADSLLMVLNDTYPNSPYGKEASASLGFVDDVLVDDAAELYRSGQSFRRIGDFTYASRQYNKIADVHRNSPYAPKALYALGWMFERDVHDNDSALHYYGLLLERYPRSEYAKDVRPSVEFALAKMNNMEVADSLLLRDLDQDLLERAKAGEKDVMEQMIDQNRNAVQVTGPGGLQMPNLQDLTDPNSPINQMIKGQPNMKNMLRLDSTQKDTTKLRIDKIGGD
jgi:tetratricopeptide (TPR) repeat protein